MTQRNIFLQLLPGFLPLFVFIVADELWGTTFGLIVAIISGIIELAYYWMKDYKFDKFILFDTSLIIVLGLVSIFLDNEAFFKLKPALIGVLMCIIIGVSVFTPKNIILSMSKRYLKGITYNNLQYQQINKKMKILFWLTLGYTILVFYSVWFMSKEAWAFISGGLFYIVFGIYFVYENLKIFLLQRKMRK